MKINCEFYKFNSSEIEYMYVIISGFEFILDYI